MIVLLLAHRLATQEGGVGRALLAPAIYMVISSLQTNLISPMAYSQGLKLNPAAILVAVMVWGFLWGAVGAFLAVAIITAIKVYADRTGRMTSLSQLLG